MSGAWYKLKDLCSCIITMNVQSHLELKDKKCAAIKLDCIIMRIIAMLITKVNHKKEPSNL